MAKYGSASVVFLLDGYNILAAKLKGLRHKVEAVQEPSAGLGDTWAEHTPTGRSKVSVVQDEAFFDTATASLHAALSGSLPSSPQATARVLVLGYAGNVLGAPFIGVEGAFSVEYSVLAQNEKLTKAAAAYAISGRLDNGVILQPLAAQSADWDTESGPVDYADDLSQRVIPITSNSQASPSVVTTPVPHGLTTGDKILISGVTGSDADINGEQTVTVISTTTFSVAVDASTSDGTGGSFVRTNSAGGGAGYQQVSAFSGFSGYVGKVRDSADDITYADLVTFDNVTSAPNGQRKTVSGTVDRYLAVDGNVTGTGSITALIGFARF